MLFIKISYPLALASGVKTLSDPFSEYSYIDIGLEYGGSFFQSGKKKMNSKVIIDILLFHKDLGLGVNDKD